MNVLHNEDIIAALATPYGKSAVAIIRISGSGCKSKAEELLDRSLEDRKLRLCTFKAENFSERLLAVYFSAPKTYTGEEIVELYPHGNMTVCDGIIKALNSIGIRQAESGEFTKRAFMNGKLDLMQCEALADIIDASTSEQLVYGNKRYESGFKGLNEVEELLVKALSTVEAVLHYGDELEGEEIDENVLSDVYRGIEKAGKLLKAELDRFAGGRIINDGCKVALIGAPNVGKSTLLNALTESDRAIVTPIAGTTRDTVEGCYVYEGKKFVIIDTAGLNATPDEVERIGIERARAAEREADIVVYVDAEHSHGEEVQNSIVVLNKCDGQLDVGTDYKVAEVDGSLKISAKNNINIRALKQKLYDMCPKESGVLCNHRQYACASRCYESLLAARAETDKQFGLEIVAAALYDAYSALTELNGEKADEKVLDSVFMRFCVGK